MSSPDSVQRVICVNRFFWPNASATSQLLTDLAVCLSQSGREINVVCSREPDAALDGFPGIRIHPVGITRLAGFGLLGKMLDFLGFYFPAALRVWQIGRRADIILVKTDPPLMSVPIALIARWRRTKLICWMQDVYPEVALQLGVHVPTRFLRRLRNWSLRKADKVVAIGERMAEVMRMEGLTKENVAVIHNWAHHEIQEVAPETRAKMRKRLGLNASDFVVGYSGNLGRAHEFHTVIDAAYRLQQEDEFNIRFLVVGGGHGLQLVRQEADRLGLRNMVFQPQQPVELLAESLAAPDLHWLSLKPELEGLIVPSKFYGAAGSGRPVLFVGSPDGEIARIIKDKRCGYTFSPGDSEGLAKAIIHFRDDAAARETASAAAAELVSSHFSKQNSLAKWHALISGL